MSSKAFSILKTVNNRYKPLDSNSELIDIDEVINWVDRQSDLAETTTKRFKDKKESNIRFEDFKGYKVGQYYNIGDGVGFLVEINNNDQYTLLCDMIPYYEDGKLKPAILPKHYHSNIDEFFDMIFGEMRDHCNPSLVIKVGSPYTYKNGVVHNPYTYSKNQIRITGYFIKNKE